MSKAAAQQQVNSAQNELDVLLAKGLSTFEARKKLKEAQTEFSLTEQKENQKLSATQSREKSSRQLEASEIIESVTAEPNKTLESLSNIQTPVLDVPLYLAVNVLLAHEHLSDAQQKQREQTTGVTELRQRQTELQAKRQGIVHRRAAGQINDDEDSRVLILIDADLEGLTALINKTVTGSQAIDTSQQERAVGEAQQALSTAINAAYIESLRSLITQFEPALVATAQTLVAAPGIITKNRWSPSPLVREACQKGVF